MKYKFVIGVIVCDKDYVYLPSLINNIETSASGNYSIIIYNNCVINYDALQSTKFNNTIILPNTYKHKNSRQVYARKIITNKAYEINADYIWFIDADDSIRDVNFNKLQHYTDIIIFPYAVEHNPYWIPFEEKGVLQVELSLTCSEYIQRPLWCKFIKTEVLKKAYDLIDAYNLPPISCSEDTIASLLSMKFAKTFSRIDDVIYFHSTERSNSESPDTHFNDIEQSTIGIREVLNMMDTLFTKEEYNSLRLDLLKYGTISWVVERICTIQNKKELNRALKAFNKKLGRKYINEYLHYTKQLKKYQKEKEKLDKKYKAVLVPNRTNIKKLEEV